MKITKKHALLISGLAILMALCTIAGATLAYLFTETKQVVNTFSPSNIDLTLVETTTDYKMIPGNTISKDPKVTVKSDVACYVFVKIEETSNFDKFMTYTVATEWTPLAGVDGVYYKELAANATFEDVSVLSGDQVTVLGSVTKSQMDALYNTDGTVNDAVCPKLTFRAAAVQKDNLSITAAYDLVKAELNPTT